MAKCGGLTAGDRESPAISEDFHFDYGALADRAATAGFAAVSILQATLRSNRSKATIVAAQKVLRSFNTWAFKREQPSDPGLMLEVIAGAIEAGRPVSFVLYWGKGPRSRLAEPDIKCLTYLSGLARRVREAYRPGAAVTLILTDTHAQLNGHSAQGIRDYFDDIALAARHCGFESCWLGCLVPPPDAAPPTDPAEDMVSEDVLLRLRECAARWYGGEGTAEQGAIQYYLLNMIEKRAVEHAFPRSIFLTFNGSEFRSLFPAHLPIFYMYSLRRGVSVKPWFISSGGSEQDDPTADGGKSHGAGP